MRGASAVEEILQRHPRKRIRVFVVWQPMLATDFAALATPVLSQIKDSRATQYWDPQHFLARRMAQDARPPQPVPNCCDQDGILWDLAALYSKGQRWDKSLPPAILFDGPVYRVATAIDAALRQVP